MGTDGLTRAVANESGQSTHMENSNCENEFSGVNEKSKMKKKNLHGKCNLENEFPGMNDNLKI